MTAPIWPITSDAFNDLSIPGRSWYRITADFRRSGEVPFHEVIALPSMAIRPRRDGLGSTASPLDAELIHDATHRGH
nr:hypothetical protein [Ferrimicrobium acidiphilum]